LFFSVFLCIFAQIRIFIVELKYSNMGKIVKVRDGKGNIFEMDESLLEGKPCTLTEGEINNLPKLDIQAYLANGYITAEDYRKSLNQNGSV